MKNLILSMILLPGCATIDYQCAEGMRGRVSEIRSTETVKALEIKGNSLYYVEAHKIHSCSIDI